MTRKPHAPLATTLATMGLLVSPCLAYAPDAADAAEPAARFEATGNPKFVGADPHAIVIDGGLYLYPTRSLPEDDGPAFHVYVTRDLEQWRRYGPILNYRDVDWIDADKRQAWAPALAAKEGRYYLYFSVGPQAKDTPSKIGVAVADSPLGPFEATGEPLLVGGDGFEAIDPMVFTDPKTGEVYLYAGGSAGSTLRVFALKDNMIELKREIEVTTPKHFTEAPFMHVREGTYYLSYSSGQWWDSSYSVHYATAESPTGPWDYQGEILETTAVHDGPGHHSFFKRPGSDRWLIAYHRRERHPGEANKERRQVAIERVEYTEAGRIKPIAMTDGPD